MPAKSSPLFYLKASGETDVSKENFTFMSNLTARGLRVVDDKKTYRDAMNSVMFDVAANIEKDHEMFAHFNAVKA